MTCPAAPRRRYRDPTRFTVPREPIDADRSFRDWRDVYVEETRRGREDRPPDWKKD